MHYDLSMIVQELAALPDYTNQIYLQGTDSNMDPIAPTIGANYLDADAKEQDYCVPLFDIPYINSIMIEHDLSRTRVMKMHKKTCYYWHNDVTQRLHIPVITNPHCFLVFEDGPVHLPATGEAYVIDTRKFHSAMNASKEDRIHIVGCLPAE